MACVILYSKRAALCYVEFCMLCGLLYFIWEIL